MHQGKTALQRGRFARALKTGCGSRSNCVASGHKAAATTCWKYNLVGIFYGQDTIITIIMILTTNKTTQFWL